MFFLNYEDMSWESLEELSKEEVYIVLPVSSIEQHGKHLPVGTDDIILQMCMDELNGRENKSEIKFLLLPRISIGSSYEHMNFCGTISYSVNTYQLILNDIMYSLSLHGFHKVIIVNGHGGNTALINGTSQELNQKYMTEIYVVDIPTIYGKCNELDELKDMDIACEIHAGDIETSMMMYKYPELVHTEKIKDYPIYFDNYYNSWITDRISKEGTLGKPSKATEQRGKLILDYIVTNMEQMVYTITKKGGLV